MNIPSLDMINQNLSDLELCIKQVKIKIKQFPLDKYYQELLKAFEIEKKQWELYIKLINEIKKAKIKKKAH